MIAVLSVRFRKYIAWFLYITFYADWAVAAEMREIRAEPVVRRCYGGEALPVRRGVREMPRVEISAAPPAAVSVPSATRVDKGIPVDNDFVGGPTQPEMQAFQSVNSNNMVDLFSGDFSYNIPLLDVGGYPVNIAYRSGVGMDDEASWVGLGWNVNPGSITRNMRGLPDDFNGGTDTVRKVNHIKANTTFGASAGFNTEIVGLPLLGVGGTASIFHSTYNGWGIESALNVSLNAGDKAHGPLSGGLSFSDNSQSGLTIKPSLGVRFGAEHARDNGGFSSGLNLGTSYNARTGLKELQLGINDKYNRQSNHSVAQTTWHTSISFAGPTYTPTMTLPLTNYNYSFTARWGTELFGTSSSIALTGYMGKEYVADADTVLALPAYGYLNFQNIKGNWASLTDFNREKEIPYRESPAVPHIAVPAYTYDVFTIAGEGTGGMFRAYRGDIGYIADHQMQTKTRSGALGIDIGGGNGVHWGGDLNVNYSTTKNGPWLTGNTLGHTIGFRQSDSIFQSVYFRNPGEKTINTTAFYNAIGGDNVVAPTLYQAGNSDPNTMAVNSLNVYNKGQQLGTLLLDSAKAHKSSRDKRSEVISYLTASEASVMGLDKHIVHYAVNKFAPNCCSVYIPEDTMGPGSGLIGYYYNNEIVDGQPVGQRLDHSIHFNWEHDNPYWSRLQGRYDKNKMHNDYFSARWLGRLRIPVSGCYTIATSSDDGARLWINDSLVIDDWHDHPEKVNKVTLSMIGNKFYNVRLEYFDGVDLATSHLMWLTPGETVHSFNSAHDTIPTQYLYPPIPTDTVMLDTIRTQEDRVNSFRKSTHISEINVLNPDGRRYVYGIPVYNLLQKEVSFSANVSKANINTGLTGYDPGDATANNNNGKDGYYSRQEIPAYAHSFLLTGILSPDYVDVTGDGISDDDIGDGVKFNYSKTAGVANPYGWRAPYMKDSANYNEGFRSYNRDDKAQYIYGSKELWYLHSIESKTMVANFILQPRMDLLGVDERGNKTDNAKAMCLKQINLYSKVDYMKHGDSAVPIKVVHFEYSYELCRRVNYPTNDSGKLTLKRIWFTYNGNEKGARNPYVFHYHQNNPNYKLNSTDRWGVYKDAAQNPAATSTNIITNAEYPYSLQDSSAAAYNAGAWTLDSIKLPSGGRIKVNYESDDYAFIQNRRAAQMFRIVGLSSSSSGGYGSKLYGASQDNMYVYIRVPFKVSSNSELFARYLDGISKIYFRINVRMPTDDFGSGYEYVPTYAEPDVSLPNWYGINSDNIIWIKVKGVNSTGDADGNLSPLAQTAINFLRLNLPSKAYPGSEVDDNLNIGDVVKILASLAGNVLEMLRGFSNTARSNGWCNQIDTARSFVRLNSPAFKKYGGGLRVKSVLIYDNWDSMAKKKPTVYGQTYSYTTTRNVNGVPTVISSGVASWEPAVGAEENPFHLPIEFVEKIAPLAPATAMYTEEPLGETFYPGASVGYSKVRVRSIHTAGTRSANGYAETSFYTSYDFPTTWDWSLLDNNTKKRYRPILQNFLRINAMSYLTLSQGFKVELNDMNGKLRSEATYAETDSVHPLSYTENFYRVDDQAAEYKHLANTVMAVDPFGNVDTVATIGKDAELMADMREQVSTSIGANIDVNADMFMVGVWPVILPSLLNLYQKETNQYRSAAMMKVIQRYGILDSVVHVDKGSTVSSKNLLYDGETGDPILVRTSNEFNDPVYQFSYPAHWAYSAAGPAYQNIDAIFYNCAIDHGRILDSRDPAKPYLTAGDELLIYSKATMTQYCDSPYAYFADAYKLWVIDTNTVHGGTPSLMLVDQLGKPFSGNDVTLRVVRSGHRNLGSSVGSIVSLGNPLVRNNSGVYHLVLDSTIGVVNAGAAEMEQFWKVADKRTSDISTSCVYTAADSAEFAAEGCSCLKPFFDYLISHNLLFIHKGIFSHTTVGELVARANAAGYSINLGSCPLLNANAALPFYATTFSPNSNLYIARIGKVQVKIYDINNGNVIPFNNLVSTTCDAKGRLHFRVPGTAPRGADTVTMRIYPEFSTNLFSMPGTTCPYNTDSLTVVDSTSDHLMVENSLNVGGYERSAVAILRWDTIERRIPFWANILSAKMVLQADHRGHIPGLYDSANSLHPSDTTGYSISGAGGWFNYQPLDTMIYRAYYSPWYKGVANKNPFQNDTLDVTDYVTNYLGGLYNSRTFILTQGSGPMHDSTYDSSLYIVSVPPNLTHDSTYDSTPVVNHLLPPYLTSGYGNYYSTYYSRHYSDSTKWPVIQVVYASTASTDTVDAVLEFNSTIQCTTITTRSCYSSITDTTVNPYQYGILGSLRPLKNYVYYGRRKESSPYEATDIRRNGTISSFAPFWQLQSGKWQPAYDTTRWTWNSQTNMFNRKGFELENADPLGRYNSGLYGYGLTLPTAVVQNGRYQEIAFDGFEDYGFTANTCDTLCPESRPFDFSAYKSYISDSMAHTGVYSLRIGKDSSVSLSVTVANTPSTPTPQLTTTDSSGYYIGDRAGQASLLPSFSPLAGKKMLVSAWVKEKNACTCQSYTRDHILVSFSRSSGPSTQTLQPSGNMIEGWQRVEAVVFIPSDATAMSVTLQASDSSTTYFDDIRVLPYNGEMKSYVYNPVNLRLMAELDENNYATFYEYDDDGTLIRVKKETERGIQTIKESRSALLKKQ